MAVFLEAQPPHILDLEASRRGWRAPFGEYQKEIPGYWEIKRTGTSVLFHSSGLQVESSLHQISWEYLSEGQ